MLAIDVLETKNAEENQNNELMDLKTVDQVTFILNGRQQTVSTSNLPPSTTLNDYLRDNLNLKGTKFMCRKGGCGACAVSITQKDPNTGVKQTKAINSCLVNILSCQNWEITTIEGLGDAVNGLHAVQQKIVDFNAAQCGFCTPGVVMSMYALREGGARPMTPQEVEHALGGNICRCTGYRPILDAYNAQSYEDEFDIEDLKLCDRNKCKNVEKCAEICASDTKIQQFELIENQKWYRVLKIRDIFTIFRQTKVKPGSYALIAGNTARGVFDDTINVPICIDVTSVAELHGYDLTTRKLTIGANCTLTETIKIFTSVSQRDDGFKYLKACAEHLNQVASVPINNMASLAGNLSIKHTHPEFQSDIFLLLEAIGAQLVITNGFKSIRLTPLQYLSENMFKKVIVNIELPPLAPSTLFDSYKIKHRAQNSIAIINACFLLNLNGNNVVTNARIVYGGISAIFTHAKRLEKFLQGKKLFDNGNLQQAFKILASEIQPDSVQPPIGADFRRDLSVALFYKFILSIAPDGVVRGINKSGGGRLTRGVSSAISTYQLNNELKPIGEAIGKLDSAIMAAGSALFITDIPDAPGQLYGVFVPGAAPPGYILKDINAKNALSTDGVVAFLQASDIDGVNSFMGPEGSYGDEEWVFLPLNSPIMFHSQPIGLILATNKNLAEQAADLVEVTFAAPGNGATVPLMSIKDVLTHNATDRVHHEQELVALYQEDGADHVIKGTATFGAQYHHFMELTVAIATPTDDNGLLLHAATQWADSVQSATARCLNMKTNQITLKQHRLGGGFGGKITRGLSAVAAALAAHKLQRPVKLFPSMEAQMNIFGKRSAAFSEYEVGVDTNGVIKYLNNSYYADMGAYGNALYSMYMLDVYLNSYESSAFQTDTYWVRTDQPAAVAMRAPGSIVGGAMIEGILEHVATKLAKDPLDVKLANLNVKKHPLLKKLIDDCVKWAEYRERRREIDDFNKVNRWRKRGISIIPLTYGLFFEKPMHVQVTINRTDGAVEVVHGGIDMGQGINTKITQVAAYLLGVDMNMIRVIHGDTFTTPNNLYTGGSVTTDSAIKALIPACNNLKTRIDNAAKDVLAPNATWLEKIQNAFEHDVNLTENAIFAEDPNNTSNYYIYGVGVSEIELDLLTGGHLVKRVDILADAGDSLNPQIDVGQIHGAFIMGLGLWTMEEILTNPDNGALLTNNTWTYKVPSAKDIPIDFRVRLADGVPNEKNAMKNKVVTQPPICLAVGIPLAMRHALQSARAESGLDAELWAELDGPSNVEWIFTNSLNDYTQYLL